MGGKGSGGARRNTGPKPKVRAERAVTGVRATRSAAVTMHPSSVGLPQIAPVEEFDAPNVLTLEERHVWLEFAPLAFKKRTLTPETSPAFIAMCRTILMERGIAVGRDAGSTMHKGWVQEVRKQLDTFDLWPKGKPVYDEVPVAKPANPLEKFLKRRA